VLLSGLFVQLGLDKSTVCERWVEGYDLTGQSLVNYGKVKEAVGLLGQAFEIQEVTLVEDY